MHYEKPKPQDPSEAPTDITEPEIKPALSPLEEIIAARGLSMVKFTYDPERPAGFAVGYDKFDDAYDKTIKDSPSEGDVMKAQHDLALRDIWKARSKKDGVNYIPVDPTKTRLPKKIN